MPEKVQQCAVDFLCVRPGQSVRAAFHDHQFASFHQFSRALSRSGEREYPVRIAMDYQGWHVNVFEIVSEVGEPRRDAIQCALGRGARADVPTELNDLIADELPAQDVQVETSARAPRPRAHWIASRR